MRERGSGAGSGSVAVGQQGALTDTPVVLPVAVPGQAPTPTLGRARPAPLRREGPDKLTGTARYTDDLVFPGAWYGATIRSTEAHARLLGIELDPDFDWSRVVVMTADDIPGDNIVSSIKEDMPALAADVIRHHAEPVALVAAPDKATLREARRRIRLRTEPLEPVFDPLVSEQQFAAYEISRGDVEARLRGGRARDRGRVPRRPPGAALHREPGHDRGAAAGRRHHHHGLDAVPLLRPRGAQARPGPERQRRPSSPRRRLAAASAARRSTPRSSPSTPPCWRSGWAGRCA